MVVDLPWEKPAPTTAPLWIMGPSLPTGRPPATAPMTPRTLQASVCSRTAPGTLRPFKTHLICTGRCGGSVRWVWREWRTAVRRASLRDARASGDGAYVWEERRGWAVRAGSERRGQGLRAHEMRRAEQVV